MASYSLIDIVRLTLAGRNRQIAGHMEREAFTADRLLIRANDKEAHLTNGDVITVEMVQNGIITAADGRTIDSGKFMTFTHGYAITSHKAQGKMAEHVVVAAAQLDSKAAYVACSRGRLTCSLHTPDKIALLERLPAGTRPATLDVAGQVLERSRAWSEMAKQRTVETANMAKLGVGLVCSGRINPVMLALRFLSKFVTEPELMHETTIQPFIDNCKTA